MPLDLDAIEARAAAATRGGRPNGRAAPPALHSPRRCLRPIGADRPLRSGAAPVRDRHHTGTTPGGRAHQRRISGAAAGAA